MDVLVVQTKTVMKLEVDEGLTLSTLVYRHCAYMQTYQKLSNPSIKIVVHTEYSAHAYSSMTDVQPSLINICYKYLSRIK